MGTTDTDKPSVFAKLAGSVLRAASTAVHYVDGSSSSKWGWDPYLKGSFAPQENEALEEVDLIEGALPAGLNGAYVRTGPNPKLAPNGGYHWFDGDGMIHSARIADGKAVYCNRYVQTSRLVQEARAGYPIVPKIGDSRGLSLLAYFSLRWLAQKLGVYDASHGAGTANTAVAFHANRLLALQEGDLPYALRLACNGLVETIGRCTFGGKLGAQHFTAHPKLDPQTGELLTFGYSLNQQPHCWYGVLDKEGNVTKEIPVELPEPIMMHDCAITQNYMLLLDTPLVFDPKVMVKERRLPFVFKDRPTRIGVVPRNASSAADIRWFDTGRRFMVFHTANAWEEGSKIRLFLCTLDKFSLDDFTAEEGSEPVLSEVVLDLESAEAAVRKLDATPAAYGDFPVVHPGLVGRPTRFVYVAAKQPDSKGVPRFAGVTKFDLQAGGGTGAIVGTIKHGGSRLGGEATFVPRPGGSGAEDDGYLLTYITNEETLASELVIYDARTMSSTPVARLRMPHRVPHGFHGLWVTGAQLAAQGEPSALLG